MARGAPGRRRLRVAESRPVPGYPGYSVTDDGAIRGPRGPLRPMAMPTGHLYVFADRPPMPRKLFVHRAVLLAFVGPCPDGEEARHDNGIASDNRLTNLSWGTRLDNMRDKARHGTEPCGDAKPQARLTAVQALAIRGDDRAARAVAADYGLSHTTVLRIRRGERWGRALDGR